MTCNAWQQRIAEVGGADPLPDDLAAHVAECQECAAVLAAEQHIRAVLAAAPWPDSVLTWDIEALRERARAADAEMARTRQRRLLRWAAGLGVLVLAGWLGLRALAARDPAAPVDPALLAALLVAGGLVWVALDLVGRRMAAAGASGPALFGLGAARAVLAVVLVVGLMHPTVQPALWRALWSAAGQPAEAGATTFETTLVCAGRADGRLRLVAWSTGCREDEQMVSTGAGSLPGAPALLPTVEYRAGTATIPAGLSSAFINFSRPMPTAGYHVTATLAGSQGRGAFASDEACRVVMVAGKSTSGFGIMFRRCWFEGEDVPVDPAKNDLTLDWIAIEPR